MREYFAQLLVHLSRVQAAADVSHASQVGIEEHALWIHQVRAGGPGLRLLLRQHLDRYVVDLLQRVRDVQDLASAANERADTATILGDRTKLAVGDHVD